MMVTCSEQNALGNYRLRLTVTHRPTLEAGQSAFFTFGESDDEAG